MAAVVSRYSTFFFDPLFHWLLLMVLALLLNIFHRQGAMRVTFILVVYYVVVAFSPLPHWLLSSLENSYPVVEKQESKQAVVVLSGGTVRYDRVKGMYSWFEGADRFLRPLRKFALGAEWLVLSGRENSEPLKNYLSEAESMGRFARESGWPTERIIIENQARSTRENARFVAAILQAKGIKDFYLVTSAYHLPRSMQSFEKQGLQPTAYPVDFQILEGRGATMGFSNIRLFRLALHEYIGMVFYWIADLFEQKELEVGVIE